MLKHNIKLFLRNIKKNKSAFLINTVGLGVGIASFLVLALYVYNDLTYNHFNENLSNIYRVREGESVQTKGPLLPELLKQVPEIENGTRIFDWEGLRLRNGDKAFQENIFYVDSGFFSVFSFPFTEGSAKNPIGDKYGVVISKTFAEKYFGKAPALGKQFQIGFDDLFLTVNGVVDIPGNSSVKFDILASYETGEEISPWIKGVHDWYNTFSTTYVLLTDGTAPESLSGKLQNIVRENFVPVGENKTQLNLLPFRKYHSVEESDLTLIVILAIIALGILGIAIVNFINLTIANSLLRTKEIGIKKVHGATRQNLLRQIMTESLLVGLAAVLFGMVFMAGFLLPAFNRLFETKLHFDPLQNTFIIGVMVSVWLLVGVVSGLVPSFLWAGGKLVPSLHGKLFSANKGGLSRYSSIVVQFVIAITLISGTFLIRKQINHMIEKDPKFDDENVIIVQTDSWQYKDQELASQKFERIANQLQSSPYVSSVAFSGIVPGTYQENYNTFYPDGESNTDKLGLRKAYVGRNYFKTYGIEMLSGNGFDRDLTSYEKTVVLNRTAMDALGFEMAQGQVLREASKTGMAYRIVGVVDDFSYQGVQREMQPLAHFFSSRENLIDWDYLSVKAKPGAGLQVINLLKEHWQEALPGATLTYFFANDKLNEHYREYVKVNSLISWFSVLAVLLSCIGLFALSAHTIAKRTKEIGIRKVNGASISQILSLLNKDFLKWVGLAFIIAVPISWYAMNGWLGNFAYKTTISWWIFALAGAVALIIALITVSWHSFKAATSNPVNALREA